MKSFFFDLRTSLFAFVLLYTNNCTCQIFLAVLRRFFVYSSLRIIIVFFVFGLVENFVLGIRFRIKFMDSLENMLNLFPNHIFFEFCGICPSCGWHDGAKQYSSGLPTDVTLARIIVILLHSFLM